MISIIIPILNQHEMTMECITSIRANTSDCEIIVIDNGSDPPIEKPYTGFIDCQVIRNEENKGFPVAVNQGIKEAKGDVIVLLNNDTIVTPGWADRLLSWLNEYDIIGPITNYSSGIQKVEIPLYENIDELNKEAGYISENNEGWSEEVRWVIGFCMVFRKSLVDEIGEFNENGWPCNGEEIDFCLRAKELGKRIGIAYDVYIHHHGSKTIQDMDIDYVEILKRTDVEMSEKWGKHWKRQTINPIPTGTSLNLGCGFNKMEGFINIDNRKEVEPDLVCDVLDGLPYSDESVDMVRAFDFLEHIPIGKTIGVVTEIWRVLKTGGIFESFTPSTDGRGAFQDPTHVSFWNKNSWLYYSAKPYRDLYNIEADFIIEKIEDTDPGEAMIIHTHVIARKRINEVSCK